MKKLFIILISVLSLTSCDTESIDSGLDPNSTGTGTGSGGTGGGTNASLIVGNWLYTDVETLTTTTTNIMGISNVITASNEFVSSDAILTFNTDGTYTIIGDLTFELFTQGMSQGNQSNTFNDSGTYTVTGDILELVSTVPGTGTPFDDTTTLTIDTLNNVDLFIDIDGMSTQNAGGSSIDVLIEGTADFERQ